MIVTAFGPFANIKLNPSEVLAKEIFGGKAIILPVSFSAVDEFLDRLPAIDRLLMLGVGRGDRGIRIERIASDYIGEHLDVSGSARPRSRSDVLKGELLARVPACDCWEESHDAGGYLCNYIYYEATKRNPGVSTGFVHVPPFTAIPLRLQLVRLRRLINLITI